MRIVLPGALPDARSARELTPHLEASAPTLVQWFQQLKASILQADPADTGCTAYEYWQLSEFGFTPEPGQRPAAGLGPLLLGAQANDTDDTPHWVVELVHLSPSRDGAALLPAAELHIRNEDSVALFESAQRLFDGSGFRLEAGTATHWRVFPTEGCTLAAASPSLVSLSSVNDWWPQDDATRPWRRLVNEIQMLWFDHPVNQQRYARQLMPINSLWLFGGARPSQLRTAPALNTLLPDGVHALQEAANSQDWGTWLLAMRELENGQFRPRANTPPHELILTGLDTIVTLQTSRWRRLTAALPWQQQHWRHWWSPHN